MATDTALFHKEKHISYWLRCLRSPLPHQYTSNDANRMTLAFFTISALDLLGVLFTRTTAAERQDFVRWIYRCQHPLGGFRGFPATDFGPRSSPTNAVWDSANLPATYFALATLAVLGDDLRRVKRWRCLEWLGEMQRPDGSFGEMLGSAGEIEGGMDTRFGYCAIGIRWILRGNVNGWVNGVADVDVDKLVNCIRASETYDGGISEEPYHEAHAGFTYCAIGALSFLNRLPKPKSRTSSILNGNRTNNDTRPPGLSSFDATLRWLVSRLTTTIEEVENYDEYLEEYNDGYSQISVHEEQTRPSVPVETSDFESKGAIRSSPLFGSAWPHWTGYNGRSNKTADTCYAFWVGASLHILRSHHLIDPAPVRQYLLSKTQHLLAGGFSKMPGDPPDLYHAYLGLAALALLEIGEPHDHDQERETGDMTTPRPMNRDSDGADDGGALIPILGDGTEDDQEGGEVFARNETWYEDLEVCGMLGFEPPGKTMNGGVGERKLANGVAEAPTGDEGGRTLRRMDPALCFSVRARTWVEGLSWRRQVVGGGGKEFLEIGG